MKMIYLLFIISFSTISLLAQTPQTFKYQAIARDEAGNILTNSQIGFRISMIQESKDGTASYVETQQVKSNPYGMINLAIGEGKVVTGDFSGINWGEDSYYIRMEMDITGGNDYKEMGISQLYAVPYALYAEEAGSLVSDDSGRGSNSSSSSSSSSRTTGTPNTKFPADDDSHLNVNTGNVGIGTTDPQEKLDVNGSIKASSMILTDSNGDQWEIIIDTTGAMLLVDKFTECGDSLYVSSN